MTVQWTFTSDGDYELSFQYDCQGCEDSFASDDIDQYKFCPNCGERFEQKERQVIIAVRNLRKSKNQIRYFTDDPDLLTMVQSMKKIGQRTPLDISLVEGKYIVIDGWLRVMAMKQAKIKLADCKVTERSRYANL